jgi:hypothetical protein
MALLISKGILLMLINLCLPNNLAGEPPGVLDVILQTLYITYPGVNIGRALSAYGSNLALQNSWLAHC